MMSVKKEFNIISWGGLGDALLTTPVFRRLKEAYPACRINIFAVRKDHKKLFEGNPNIDTLTHSFFKRRKFYRDKTAVVPSYGHLLPGTFLKDHASSIIAEYFFNLQLNDLKPEIFLTGKEVRKAAAFLSEYKNPVIINPTSRSSANHEWDIRNWEKVVSQLPGFTFLQLGLKDEAYIKGAIDLRGKCSLRHSMALVKSAKAFVGVDSFLGHVAAATGTPAVVLFGDSTPLVWGHAANTNIYKALPCSPCVDILHGKKCFYGRPCMTGITVDEVIEAVQNHLTSHRDE